MLHIQIHKPTSCVVFWVAVREGVNDGDVADTRGGTNNDRNCGGEYTKDDVVFRSPDDVVFRLSLDNDMGKLDVLVLSKSTVYEKISRRRRIMFKF